MRRIFIVPVLIVSMFALTACAGGSEETGPGDSPVATAAPASNGEAPVIAHSKELTTIYFVHAEW